MKILIAGVEQVKSGELYMDEKGWSFRRSFERLGLDVDDFFYRKKGTLAFIERSSSLRNWWRAYMNAGLVKYVRKTKPDVLFITKGESITAETLQEIRRKTDTEIVNVFPDNPVLMGRFEAIAPCSRFFIKDTFVRDQLHMVGLKNVVYLPQCTDPEVHKPVELDASDMKEYSADVSLVGSMYPYRTQLVSALADLKPALWGKGWQKAEDAKVRALQRAGDIRGTKKAKAICASKISLNLHHPLNDIWGVNRRTYDVAACGGFQLSDYKKDMDQLFAAGKELVCFRSLPELREMISYYLSHEEERRGIAEASRARVLRDHTYDRRAKEILGIIGNPI